MVILKKYLSQEVAKTDFISESMVYTGDTLQQSKLTSCNNYLHQIHNSLAGYHEADKPTFRPLVDQAIQNVIKASIAIFNGMF
ncbi:hypothetical protein BFC19_04890 [Brochothrix thermosphacta]|uniref:hypothetical protein n=1 Tax=Brochothrix thermosphacta TaxID=2756 RepID=UPI000E726C26|nr:hypothetical protein [Brochothrix thermosphacta]ANZ94781.1 hypothetical protein BFC19_04890 [Brochothrix thermosphacta]